MNRKKARAEGETCHAKTMMSRKAYEAQRQTPGICRVGRARRKKYEGRSEKWGGAARVDEPRNGGMQDREERSRGMETLIFEALAKIKPFRLANQAA
jgi:hypothetical protein